MCRVFDGLEETGISADLVDRPGHSNSTDPLRDRRGSASARLVDRSFRAARVSERTPMR
jgi:hypothetical protein